MNITKLRHLVREEIEASLDGVAPEATEIHGFDVTDFSAFRTWFANALTAIGCPQDLVNLVADIDDAQSPVSLALYDAWADLNCEHENEALDDEAFMGVVETLVRDLKGAHRSPRFMVESTVEKLKKHLNN